MRQILRNKTLLFVLATLIFVPLLLELFVHPSKKVSPSVPLPTHTPRTPLQEVNGRTKVILDAVGGEAGREGWVIIQASEGKTWLNINIDADEVAEDDHDFPARLRSGSCDKLGEVVHTLNAAESGASETTLAMSLEAFRASLPLSLVVEQSPTDHTVVACGEITTVY